MKPKKKKIGNRANLNQYLNLKQVFINNDNFNKIRDEG